MGKYKVSVHKKGKGAKFFNPQYRLFKEFDNKEKARKYALLMEKKNKRVRITAY
jgi:hypothetical protein